MARQEMYATGRFTRVQHLGVRRIYSIGRYFGRMLQAARATLEWQRGRSDVGGLTEQHTPKSCGEGDCVYKDVSTGTISLYSSNRIKTPSHQGRQFFGDRDTFGSQPSGCVFWPKSWDCP